MKTTNTLGFLICISTFGYYASTGEIKTMLIYLFLAILYLNNIPEKKK